MADQSICTIEGCGKPDVARGWCGAHYRRWRRHGDPLALKAASPGEPVVYLRDVVLKYEGGECLIWPFARDGGGYGKVFSGGRLTFVSRLVCEAVNGPPPTNAHQAAHGCGRGDKGCVAPGHLRWATPSENCADRLAHGTVARGERHGSARMTVAQVREIRLHCLRQSQVAVAKMFGVSASLVNDIVKRRTWAWLE